MTGKVLISLLKQKPFVPFVMNLTGGHTVHVRRPEWVRLLRDGETAEVREPTGRRCLVALRHWTSSTLCPDEAEE